MSGQERMKIVVSKPVPITPANSPDINVSYIFEYSQQIDERDKLAEKYNNRIVEFLEQAASEPGQFQLPDKYTAGKEAKQDQMMFFGRERFKFTDNAKDEERLRVRRVMFHKIQASFEKNALLDT